jgi:hypothetical protein
MDDTSKLLPMSDPILKEINENYLNNHIKQIICKIIYDYLKIPIHIRNLENVTQKFGDLLKSLQTYIKQKSIEYITNLIKDNTIKIEIKEIDL